MSQLAKQKRMTADALRRTIQGIEEAGSADRPRLPLGIPAIDRALPGGGLRLGGIHEVTGDESATGFCAALLARAGGAGARSAGRAGGRGARFASGRPGSGAATGTLLWLAEGDDLYAPGLVRYGIGPGQLLVVSELRRQDDMLWAMEEALRCRAVSGVVAEIGQIGLIAGRRLMLAAEGTGVLGLVLSRRARGRGRGGVGVRAAISRWRVTAVPARTAIGEIGPPRQTDEIGWWDETRWRDGTRWRIELLHCRGGRPAEWTVSWSSSKADLVHEVPRPNHNNVAVGRGRQEGAVSAHDVPGPRGHRTREKLVVIPVRTNRFRQRRRRDQGGEGGDQLQRGFRIHAGKARRQSLADPNVFLDNLAGHHEFDSPVAPGRKHVARRSAEEHT